MQWSRDTVTVGDKSFPAASHLPVLVYPNPIAPSRYVVLNSGLTIAENSYTSDYSMPTLGDIAVLQVQPESDTLHGAVCGILRRILEPAVVDADVEMRLTENDLENAPCSRNRLFVSVRLGVRQTRRSRRRQSSMAGRSCRCIRRDRRF